MKRIKRIAAMAVSLMLILAMFVPTAMADTVYGVIKTPMKDGSVHLRVLARVSQSIACWAHILVDLVVLYEGNTWHRVRLIKNGKTGWVYGRYLKITDTASSETQTGAQVSGTVAQVITKYPSSKINLRYGAGTQYAIVGVCGRGTRLEILDESGNWYKVQVAGSGKEGWMSKTYVSLGMSASTTARVNLRYGAGTGYAVIRTLKKGQSVTVTWVGDKWSKVLVDGETGYISNSYYRFK